MELRIVRHGHTDNPDKLQGERPNELITPKGALQAIKLADKIMTLGPPTIRSSPSLRAWGFANIVVARLLSLGIRSDFEKSEQLSEINLGKLNNQPWSIIETATTFENTQGKFDEKQEFDFNRWKGESSEGVRKRLLDEAEHTKFHWRGQTSEMKKGPRVWISHGGDIRMAYNIWRPNDMPNKIKHGSIHIFQV